MKIQIIEKTKQKINLLIENSNPSEVNRLRIILLSELEKMSIDIVEFELGPQNVNDIHYSSITPLFDEIISHRLGLIPLSADPSDFKQNCDCESKICTNCSIIYSLSKTGPTEVFSKDLIPEIPKYKIKNENIPIVTLKSGQYLKLKAIAKKNNAKTHIKWQVALAAGYKYFPSVKILKQNNEFSETVSTNCPKKVFSVNNKKELILNNPSNCCFCSSCTSLIGNDHIEITSDSTKFIFNFETDGSLSTEHSLKEAIKKLEKENILVELII